MEMMSAKDRSAHWIKICECRRNAKRKKVEEKYCPFQTLIILLMMAFLGVEFPGKEYTLRPFHTVKYCHYNCSSLLLSVKLNIVVVDEKMVKKMTFCLLFLNLYI